MSTLTLRHATATDRLGSILDRGLLPSMARGRLKCVWFHTKSETNWAVLHHHKHHGTPIEKIVVIEVKLSRSQLVRRWRGKWTSSNVVEVWGRCKIWNYDRSVLLVDFNRKRKVEV